MTVVKKNFGQLSDGKKVSLYILKNDNGAEAHISDFGGTVVRLYVPDKNGKFDDVVCGYDDLDSYINGDGYQGAIIGRYGNRIASGKFTIDDKLYSLYCNDGNNHLHGGKCGFSHRMWDAKVCNDALELHLVSEDGDEGYPGCLDIVVKYRLTSIDCHSNALEIEYHATTDKKTAINLTNHTYFNLNGYASGNVLDHELKIDADSYLPVGAGLIPTGEIKPVIGTPFDFSGKRIGQDINSTDPDITVAGGYDVCFVFNGGEVEYSDNPPCRCNVYCGSSGRCMDVFTDRPCVQLYTANFMVNPCFPLKDGVPQQKHGAICLETQFAPDAMNQSEFGSFSKCIFDAEKPFHSKTIYYFSVR